MRALESVKFSFDEGKVKKLIVIDVYSLVFHDVSKSKVHELRVMVIKREAMIIALKHIYLELFFIIRVL